MIDPSQSPASTKHAAPVLVGKLPVPIDDEPGGRAAADFDDPLDVVEEIGGAAPTSLPPFLNPPVMHPLGHVEEPPGKERDVYRDLGTRAGTGPRALAFRRACP